MALHQGSLYNECMNIYLGVDTGGTFTDFVLFRDGLFSTHKVLSTPHAPEQAILTGLNDLSLNSIPDNTHLYIVHGSTVATNAVLEGKGVSTVFITNRGFKDMLTIGRQARCELYNLQPAVVSSPVQSDNCIETGGRLSSDAEVLEPLTDNDLAKLVKQIKTIKPQAVAINCLFSYLDDYFEKQIEQALINGADSELFISRSSNILPEYKEYERGMTTWLNAYIGPLVKGYLARLQQGVGHAQISVMQSAGNTIAAEYAGDQAVHMLLSGPAGGLAAVQYLAELTNNARMLTFDMGGTSTDVALIEESISLTNESKIAGYPVAVPMVDMHTIGAGGGSIAYVDNGGLLQVGPQSAGAVPGPACYDQAGKQATVTDANLVLGRLLTDTFLGGSMRLDESAAQQAIACLAEKLNLSTIETAQGIIKIANEHMASALRVMSVQRGIDPRELVLTSFGGAGGLHVCALADALQIKTAMVPVHAGVLSAFGMLVAPKGREYSRTFNCILKDETKTQESIDAELEPLVYKGVQALIDESVASDTIEIATSLDCRYQGQSYTLNVPYHLNIENAIKQSKQKFINLHQQRYGHSLELPIELVNVRASLKSTSTTIVLDKISNNNLAKPYRTTMFEQKQIDVYQRDEIGVGQTLIGPVLVTEVTATTYINKDWQCSMDEYGNLILKRI